MRSSNSGARVQLPTSQFNSYQKKLGPYKASQLKRQRVLLLFQINSLANESSQEWVHLRGENRDPSGGKIAWLSPFILLPRLMQVKLVHKPRQPFTVGRRRWEIFQVFTIVLFSLLYLDLGNLRGRK